MPPWLRHIVCRIPCILTLAVSLAAPAVAADITVLTSRTLKPVLLDLSPGFLTKTGHTLTLTGETTGGMSARLARGEEIDLVIMPVGLMDGIVAQGRVSAGSVMPVARSGIGLVVRNGGPVPDISSVEAFKQTLIATSSLAYIDPQSGDAGGIYLSGLFDRLGIAAVIKGKTVLVPGGLTASRVNNGQAALALQQISELRAVSNVTYVGPLPDAIQNYAIYAAGIPTTARHPAAAKAMLQYLTSDVAAHALSARGFDRP